ncbi:hypothetical protein PanWU01x14_328650 [Parasponia andersonii]|uniref:Transmembrane protein n=1 Tax=Parasponia andersonii TaxID=3476 RepID=A0A2P5AIP0_PARAD|nr:hypothetical protein PanWU01x14_328650 [Parasponia andersonii]
MCLILLKVCLVSHDLLVTIMCLVNFIAIIVSLRTRVRRGFFFKGHLKIVCISLLYLILLLLLLLKFTNLSQVMMLLALEMVPLLQRRLIVLSIIVLLVIQSIKCPMLKFGIVDLAILVVMFLDIFFSF